MVAFAGHPLTIDDKLVGVMAMFSRKPLSDVTLTGLATVSTEIALGIERKRAEETMRRLNRELQAVSTCNQVLVRAGDEQTLVDDICRIICDEAGYRLAWIGYAEHDEAKTVRPVAWAGFDSGYVANTRLSWSEESERGQGPGGAAIRTGEVIYIQNLATDPRMAPWHDSAVQRGYHSIIALPLDDENKNTFGVLIIYSAEINAFTSDEIRLLKELSGDLAFGITALRTRIERKRSEEALHLQAVELEEEVAERQLAQESLQEQALLLENEIEERRNAQDELEQLNDSLEQRVGERTAELAAKNAELERMNKIFVGRELRMMELKERIKELEGE
jgi:GAF domain-containing protein